MEQTVLRTMYRVAGRYHIPIKNIFELQLELDEEKRGLIMFESFRLREDLSIQGKCAVCCFTSAGRVFSAEQLTPALRAAVRNCVMYGITDFLFPIEDSSVIGKKSLTRAAAELIRDMREEYPDIRTFAYVLESESEDGQLEGFSQPFHRFCPVQLSGSNRAAVFYQIIAEVMDALIAAPGETTGFRLGVIAERQSIPFYNLLQIMKGAEAPMPAHQRVREIRKAEQLELLERELGVYPEEHPINAFGVLGQHRFRNNRKYYSYHRCIGLLMDFIQFYNDTAYYRGIAVGTLLTDDYEKEIDSFPVFHTVFYQQFRDKLQSLLEALRTDSDPEWVSLLYPRFEAIDRRLQIDRIGYLLLGFQFGRTNAAGIDREQDERFENHCKERMKQLCSCPFDMGRMGVVSPIVQEPKSV